MPTLGYISYLRVCDHGGCAISAQHARRYLSAQLLVWLCGCMTRTCKGCKHATHRLSMSHAALLPAAMARRRSSSTKCERSPLGRRRSSYSAHTLACSPFFGSAGPRYMYLYKVTYITLTRNSQNIMKHALLRGRMVPPESAMVDSPSRVSQSYSKVILFESHFLAELQRAAHPLQTRPCTLRATFQGQNDRSERDGGRL